MLSTDSQKALKIGADGSLAATVSPIPSLKPNEVLVHVRCIALNPFDAKSLELSPTAGATIGCDFSGDVVEIGHFANDESSVRVGDRVCGCVFGNNPQRPQNGAFGEYVAVSVDLLVKIPESLDYESAATLGVGLATVGMALYHNLKLPLPFSPNHDASHVLVYGGSTATGTLAIQMLRLSGFTPIVTCSPHNFDLVYELGAEAAFDYHSPTCGDEIREHTVGKLSYALDCVSDTKSISICYEAIGRAGGKYISLDPFPIRGHTRRSVEPDWVLSLTMYNQPIAWKRPFNREARPKDREFMSKWLSIAQRLLNAGEIKCHPRRAVTGSWEKVTEGLDMLRKGSVSGQKLVYTVA